MSSLSPFKKHIFEGLISINGTTVNTYKQHVELFYSLLEKEKEKNDDLFVFKCVEKINKENKDKSIVFNIDDEFEMTKISAFFKILSSRERELKQFAAVIKRGIVEVAENDEMPLDLNDLDLEYCFGVGAK